MRTFHTPFSPYNTHLSGRTPHNSPYAQRHKMRVLSLLYRKGKKGRALHRNGIGFFILIINFKIKQT